MGAATAVPSQQGTSGDAFAEASAGGTTTVGSMTVMLLGGGPSGFSSGDVGEIHERGSIGYTVDIPPWYTRCSQHSQEDSPASNDTMDEHQVCVCVRDAEGGNCKWVLEVEAAAALWTMQSWATASGQ